LDDANRAAIMLKSLDSSLESNNASALLKGPCKLLTECPKFLSSLVFRITTATPTCKPATNFSAADTTAWKNGAPFTGYPILVGKGLRTPIGWVHDTLIRLAANSFELHIDSLTLDQANYLDIAIVVAANAGTGKLLYAEQGAIFTATGQHRYLARYI